MPPHSKRDLVCFPHLNRIFITLWPVWDFNPFPPDLQSQGATHAQRAWGRPSILHSSLFLQLPHETALLASRFPLYREGNRGTESNVTKGTQQGSRAGLNHGCSKSPEHTEALRKFSAEDMNTVSRVTVCTDEV